ncbi:unnamed protein product [Caretta caretta]
MCQQVLRLVFILALFSDTVKLELGTETVVLFSMETGYRKIVPYANVFMGLCIVSHKCFKMVVMKTNMKRRFSEYFP